MVAHVYLEITSDVHVSFTKYECEFIPNNGHNYSINHLSQLRVVCRVVLIK